MIIMQVPQKDHLWHKDVYNYYQELFWYISNSYTIVCPPVCGDDLQALVLSGQNSSRDITFVLVSY